MSAKRSPGRVLTTSELGEVFTVAMKLDFFELELRPLLLADLPPGFTSHLKGASSPSLQLQSDLNELNRHEALVGLEGRPLAAWLRAAVRLAGQRCRVEGADLQRLLALVEGLEAPGLRAEGTEQGRTDAPLHEASAVGRLRALIRDVLAAEPGLCGRLATSIKHSPDADALADHCLGLSVEDLIDPLLDIAQESTAMRLAAARLAQVVLPAATDWRAFRAARQRQVGGGTVHLEVPFLISSRL